MVASPKWKLEDDEKDETDEGDEGADMSDIIELLSPLLKAGASEAS